MTFRGLAARKRVDPTRSLAPALRKTFHENLRSGDMGVLRQMLENEPLLAQARNRNRETPLFIAAVHPDANKAVEMIDLLMENGAVLGSRDLQKRNVLLYACHHGVEWEVVECLMKWNAAKGGGILKWSHCDGEVRSSLILASERGHTRLALRLLDEISFEQYAVQNHPFHVLHAVIESGNEPHALAICEHPKIKHALAANDMKRYKGCGGPLDKYTIAKCTKAAIRVGMACVLQLMDQQNHPKVSNATWCYIQDSSEYEAGPGFTNPVILNIAEQFAKDWRWEQVKDLFLIRYRGCDADHASEQLRAHVLVHLPDQLLHLIVQFIRPKEICKCDAESGPFEELFADFFAVA